MATGIEKLKQVDIDEAKLSDELCTQASSYLHAAELYIRKSAEYDRLKFKRDQLRATLDGEIRTKAVEEGKKITESAIFNEIERNGDFKKVILALINIGEQVELLKALKDAWYQRKDMLIQLAIKQRAEIEGLSGGTVKGDDFPSIPGMEGYGDKVFAEIGG